MLGKIETILGLENHVEESEFAGDAWISHPDGTAVSSAAGFPVDNLNSSDQRKIFRSSDLTTANTSLIRRFETDEPRLIGSAFLNQTNLTEKAVVEFFAGERVAERTVELEDSDSEYIQTGLELDATPDFTFFWRGLIRPALATDYATSDQIAFFGTANSFTASDFFVYLNHGADPTEIIAASPRYGGVPGTIFLNGVFEADGLTECEIVFRVRNSDNSAEFLINGVTQESTTSNPAVADPTVEDNRLRIGDGSARLRVLETQLWDSWIEDLSVLRKAEGHEHGLRLLWRMTGTGTQVTDLTPSAVHGTINGGSSRGMLWNRSASQMIKQVYGESQNQKALFLSGSAAASVTSTVTATSPRTFTVEFKIIANRATIDFGTFHVIFQAVSVNDCSLRVATTGDIRLWIRGAIRLDLGATLDDGLTHRVRVAVDGHLDTFVVDVDGSEAVSGSCDSYSTGSSYTVLTASRVGVSFQLWDVRLYGGIRRSDTSAWRPVSPHEDPETLILLPLDGHVVDRVSGTAATVVGTAEYRNVSRTVSAVRPAGRLGEATSTDHAKAIPRNVAGWWDAALCQEVAVVVFDPGNDESYVEISTLGFFSTLVPRISRSEGRTLSRVSRQPRFTPGMTPRYQPEPEYDLHKLVLGYLDRDESIEAFQRIDRVKKHRHPIMVVITSWAEDVFQPWESIYALIHRTSESTEGKAELYSKKLTLIPMALTDWR